MGLSKIRVAKLTTPKTLLSILLQLSVILFSVSAPFLYPQKAEAKMTLGYVRFDRQSNGAQLGGVVCYADDGSAPNGQSQGINKVIVNFPSSFVVNAATWTVDTTAANLPTGVTAWPTVTGPSVVDNATKAAIFSTGDITTGNTYCFHFSTTGTNNVGTGGNDQNAQVWGQKVTAGFTTSIINFGYATSILPTANGELIGVTASVSGTFTFALSGGATGQTLPLGVLNSSTPTTAPYVVTATMTTNAQRGWLAWVKSANAALSSAATGSTLPSVSSGTAVDLTSNTGYGLYAYSDFATTANVTVPFEGGVGGAGTWVGTKVGQIHSTQFDQIASYGSAISSQTFKIGTRAKLAGTEKPATDYADTITVVAAGSF